MAYLQEATVVKTKAKQPSKLILLAKKLHQQNLLEEKLKKQLVDLHKEQELTENELSEHMATEELNKFTVDKIGTVYLHSDIKPAVKDESKFFAFLRSNGAGALIKEAVQYQTMKAYVKEQLELKNIVPAGIDVFSKIKPVIRKS